MQRLYIHELRFSVCLTLPLDKVSLLSLHKTTAAYSYYRTQYWFREAGSSWTVVTLFATLSTQIHEGTVLNTAWGTSWFFKLAVPSFLGHKQAT